MKLNVKMELTVDQVKAIVEKLELGKTKSEVIKELFMAGMEVKDISTNTGIRYNHVYNVVRNEVFIKGLTGALDETKKREGSKKDKIEQALLSGKSITDVSAEFKCMYNYVWKISKELKQKAGKEFAKDLVKTTLEQNGVTEEQVKEVLEEAKEIQEQMVEIGKKSKKNKKEAM